MKILVRLPNWLGDMVMATGFLHQLPHFFPGSEVSVIAKNGIHELLPFFPPVQYQFVFDKKPYPGVRGNLAFGALIKRTEMFDLFFSLPNSFSTALTGFSTGARQRIGYRKELRQVLLTHAYAQPKGLHRADEYIRLLELFTGKPAAPVDVSLPHQLPRGRHIVVNINSEASSRRLTTAKAIELVKALRSITKEKIVLIGAPKERAGVEAVLQQLPDRNNIENLAGATSLVQLAELLATASRVLTTDSGPAHLANALGTPVTVLFGAGRESHTAPYRPEGRNIIRLGQLSCEPCEKNTCARFGMPQCLERLDVQTILQTLQAGSL